MDEKLYISSLLFLMVIIIYIALVYCQIESFQEIEQKLQGDDHVF